jgi:DNA primase
MECRTLCLPDGQDPCDWFSRHDKSEFESLLARDGLASVSFLCGRELESLDPGQPGGHEAAAAAVLEACKTIIDPVRRDGIAGEVARLCGLDRNLIRAGGAVAARREQAPAGVGRRSPSARVRSEFVAVAGLATVANGRQALAELEQAGALEHPAAQRLAELGRELPGDPIDPVEWIAVVREHEQGLATSLDRLLFPAPGTVMPSYEEAVNFLKTSRQASVEKAARRTALSQPDLAADGDALKALDQSLRAQHGRQTTNQSTQERGSSPV